MSLAELLAVSFVDSGFGFACSANGEEIVFSWNRSGVWDLWSWMNGQVRLVGGTPRGANFSPRFAPDGSLGLACDADGSESYRLFLLDCAQNSLIDLTPPSGALQPNFDFSPDGSMLAYLSDETGCFALHLLDRRSGDHRLLLDLQRPMWDVRWSPDGRQLVVEAEAEASGRMLVVVSMDEPTSWDILSEDDATLNAQHPAWSADSTSLAFSAEHGEWFQIAVWNVNSQQLTWLTDSEGDHTQPTWARSGETLGWVHSTGARTTLEVRQRDGSIRQFSIGQGVHSHPHLLDDDVILIYEDAARPADLWRIPLCGGDAAQLTVSLPQPLECVMPQEITYPALDGAPVPALLYKVPGSQSAVIDIHGGPNWHMQFSWNPLLAWMTAQGWTVLAPNYRGSTGYGRQWQISSRYNMGGVDRDDCAAAARFLFEGGLAERVAVTGRSHGGFLTMACLTGYPQWFAGGSAVVPFLNWVTSHDASREDLQHWNIENMGDPLVHRQRWIDLSPYFFLDRVRAPVQMICGGNDPRCPASDPLSARDRLVELGRPVELHLYPDEGHTFYQPDNILDAETKRINFLHRVLSSLIHKETS